MRKQTFTPEEQRKKASACALRWYYRKLEEGPEFKEKHKEKYHKWKKENPEGYKGIKQRINAKNKLAQVPKKKLTEKEKKEKQKINYQKNKTKIALWKTNNPDKIKSYVERAKEKKRLNKKPKLTEEQKKERKRNYYIANRERILSKRRKC